MDKDLAKELSPPKPSIDGLSRGGVAEACKAVGIRPPSDSSPREIDAARNELKKLGSQQQIDLVLYMCTSAFNDLQWLLTKDGVHGAGSVVLDRERNKPRVVLRPEVVRDLEGNKHVAYLTVDGGLLEESELGGHYVHTEWQMGSMEQCKNLGITKEILTMSPFGLYRLADRWGVKCRGCSDEKVREMVLEKAVQLRKDAYMETVNKAWKGQPDIFVGPTPSTQVAATETAAIQDIAVADDQDTAVADDQDTAVAEELPHAEEQKAEELPIKKSKKARRKALQTPLASSGGSESTAQIMSDAQWTAPMVAVLKRRKMRKARM